VIEPVSVSWKKRKGALFVQSGSSFSHMFHSLNQPHCRFEQIFMEPFGSFGYDGDEYEPA
jgi:hypothetical protein